MNFQEIVDFLNNNWAVILGVSAITIPLIWAFINQLYKNRLAELQAKINKEKNDGEKQGLKRNLPIQDLEKPGRDQNPFGPWFPCTNPDSENDLLHRLEKAKDRIIIFGLTRNFYATYPMRKILTKKSLDVPIRLYMMEPSCDSRKDRYRIEPLAAALEDPYRFEREVAGPYRELLENTERSDPGSEMPGLSLYYFNFPCSFAIELIDDSIRIMLYGHGKRGTDSPIFVFNRGNEYFQFFDSQISWIERLASGKDIVEWKAKNIAITPFI